MYEARLTHILNKFTYKQLKHQIQNVECVRWAGMEAFVNPLYVFRNYMTRRGSSAGPGYTCELHM